VISVRERAKLLRDSQPRSRAPELTTWPCPGLTNEASAPAL